MNDKLDESTLLDQLMNHFRDCIYFKDSESRFILTNEEMAKRAGFDSPEELIGKTDLDLFTEEHGREAFNDEHRIIQTGDPLYGKEEKETWEDGHETWVSTTKMPLRSDEGEIVGTFGISRDITDRKTAEILAAAYAEQNRRLRDEMESDLIMAAELQKTFLPSTYPVFPDGVSRAASAVRFFHHYHTTDAIGGDFCSIRKLSDTEAGILLCDVMGHGVRAALVTALIRGIVEEISLKEQDPAQFLDHLNKALKPIMQEGELFMVATACYMMLDVSTGTIRYANAGHPTPILLHADNQKAEWLVDDPSACGPALAMAADTKYTTIERTIEPGAAVVMYTDGIYEVANEEGEEFGTDRLLELAQSHRSRLLTEMFPTLVEEIQKFAASGNFDDDVCLVGYRLDRLMVQ